MTAHYDPKLQGSSKAEAFSLRAFAHVNAASPDVKRRTDSLYRAVFKRMFDIVLVCAAAPIIVLTVAILAMVVAMDGGNPFYFQDRVGRGGRTYRMWKLRSMVVNADDKLTAHLKDDAAARREWDSTQKLKFDPRITRFGRGLRKCSLDELPQLWNVLKGDMSLVGPRPMMPSQRIIYPGTAYYRLRPGITGPWQVSERNDSTFAARAMFDQDYDRELSLGTDVVLLVRTVAVVFRATGY